MPSPGLYSIEYYYFMFCRNCKGLNNDSIELNLSTNESTRLANKLHKYESMKTPREWIKESFVFETYQTNINVFFIYCLIVNKI